MSYKIYTLKTFDEVYENLDGSEQIWIQNMKKQLETHVTEKYCIFHGCVRRNIEIKDSIM